jgi:pyruvate carboxylase
MMRGNLGQPPGGFPPGIQKKVLKDEQPITTNAPAGTCRPVDLEATPPRPWPKELEGFRSMTRT